MVVYYDSLFGEHDTGRHPECPERLSETEAHLRSQGVWDELDVRAPRAATEEEICLVHVEDHISFVQKVCDDGGGFLDTDTPVGAKSYEVALRAAGACLEAVDLVASDSSQHPFGLVRPPGHHACPDRSMGFCVINNVAVAARYAQVSHGFERIGILDWDVHHGNGTQAAFYSDPSVLYLSFHKTPFYPGTGQAHENGSGAGEGFTVNYPLPSSTTREEYLEIFQEAFPKAWNEFKPDLTIISAGFDAYELDPIGDGGFGLTAEDFGLLTRIVLDTTDRPIVSMLEGGYSLSGLPLCIEQHLSFLHNR